MSELQIGLAVIGAVVVAGVLVYNRLQERGARRDAEGAFRSGHEDVLMQAPARAGAGGGGEESAAPDPAHATGSAVRAVHAQADLQAAPRSPDPAIDYVLEFRSEAPAADATVHEHWAAIERLHAGRALLATAGDARSWRAGLQLVTRDGAIGEAELIEFRSAVETLAAAIGATVTAAPEMRSAVEAARELDGFCVDHDIQVVIHVQGGPFPGTKIRATAESSGLVLEDAGRFALRNDAGVLLYTLSPRDGAPFHAATIKDAAPSGLTLSIDVARAPDTRRTFESMARLAHHLTAVLGGSLVDDNGHPLDERAVAAIAQELEAVGARLEARGIPPGGPAALRLFS